VRVRVALQHPEEPVRHERRRGVKLVVRVVVEGIRRQLRGQ